MPIKLPDRVLSEQSVSKKNDIIPPALSTAEGKLILPPPDTLTTPPRISLPKTVAPATEIHFVLMPPVKDVLPPID